MPRLQKPRRVREGARIAIVAPAGPIEREALEAGARMWRALGFEPVYRDDILARQDYLAGSDARRADELMGWIRDPGVAAIVCARGGYGAHRIIARLDADAVRAARKPLVGYSDATTLLLWQRRQAGLVGVHGPMLERGAGVDPEAMAALVALLSGERPAPLRGEPVAPGLARGRLVGGSLNLAVHSLGTPWEIDTRGAILMLEDITELPYRIDRLLQHLAAAGKLAGCAGIAIGAMVDCDDARYPTSSAGEVMGEILAPLGVPVLSGLPFGHVARNFPWPFGARAEIDAERGELRFLEAGVARD